jgi:hypothetical protein
MTSRTAVRARALARVLALVLALGASAAAAEEVAVCFNYGCSEHAIVRYSPVQLGRVQGQFVDADSPVAERAAIARAVAWLYFYAGMQSPIWRDRGENFDDDASEPGRMDCIDHSTNTTAYLALIERYGWLRFHRVSPPVLRGGMFDEHRAARVEERGSKDEWVIDTWFLDPGLPAAVFPLKAWLDGARPLGPKRARAAQ